MSPQDLTSGANDMLIAAHALALGVALVTDNVREFARLDGLAVENWRR
jgi:tRNA(fMet)-specific endonuclease VapC